MKHLKEILAEAKKTRVRKTSKEQHQEWEANQKKKRDALKEQTPAQRSAMIKSLVKQARSDAVLTIDDVLSGGDNFYPKNYEDILEKFPLSKAEKAQATKLVLASLK